MTCPKEGDNHWKRWLIPHKLGQIRDWLRKAEALWEGPVVHQLVGEVKAHQGDDG